MNLITKKHDISFTRGDTYSFAFDVSALTQVDLTAAYMTLKNKSSPDGTALFVKKLNSGITKVSKGVYQVSIGRADTIDLDVDGKYMYDIEVKYASEIKTVIYGALKVFQDYTTPEEES